MKLIWISVIPLASDKFIVNMHLNCNCEPAQASLTNATIFPVDEAVLCHQMQCAITHSVFQLLVKPSAHPNY